MSALVIRTSAPAAVSGAAANPWLIAIVVALASFMEVPVVPGGSAGRQWRRQSGEGDHRAAAGWATIKRVPRCGGIVFGSWAGQ